MSSARLPTMMPTSVIPASRIASRQCSSTGRLATGTACFAIEWLNGRNRVPRPPESTRAFIVLPYVRLKRGGDFVDAVGAASSDPVLKVPERRRGLAVSGSLLPRAERVHGLPFADDHVAGWV